MPLRLYKMGIEGKVAVINLALIGCALAVILHTVDINPFFMDARWVIAREAATIAIAVLGFPMGWIAVLGLSTNGPDETVFVLLMIFLPLNAYVWGYVVGAIVRLRKALEVRGKS